MSQDNVEIVRGAFDTWNGRPREPDFSPFHPELVYHPRADEPDPSPHVGRDAYERLVLGFVESFSEVTFEVLELIVNGRVVSSRSGDGGGRSLTLTAGIPLRGSAWIIARARGRKQAGAAGNVAALR